MEPIMKSCIAIVLLFASISQADVAPLRAGFGETDVSPKVGGNKPVFLAGFGHDRKATALHDPIMARAVVLAHDKQKIALVCVDVVGLFHATAEAVRKQLPEYAYVLVSSTHNHEGPDTLGLWGATPFSSGVDPEYMKHVVAGIVKAVKQADAGLQPVTVRFGEIKAPQLLHDSRLPICLHDDLVVIEFTSAQTKKPHGVLMQWNCHPEALGSKNTQVSADFVAGAVKELSQSQGCPVAYFTGTVGGLLSPSGVKVPGLNGEPLQTGFERTDGYGRLVAKEAAKALAGARPATLTPFDVRTREIQVPVDNSMYQLGWSLGILQRPLFVWQDTPCPAKPQPAKDLSKRTAIQTEVGYLKLGDLEVAIIPGEIYPELVLGKVEDPADKNADFPNAPIEPAIYAQLKGKHRMLIGLGNDELGYLIPKRQWDEKPPFCYGLKKAQYGEVNSCGPDAAPVICKTFADLVNGVKP